MAQTHLNGLVAVDDGGDGVSNHVQNRKRLAEEARKKFGEAVMRPTTAVTLSQGLSLSSLTTGSREIDYHIAGGIPVSGSAHVVEISGVAGSGKSQLAMQLALCATLSKGKGGFSCYSILILTEGEFQKRRFLEIERGLKKRYGLADGMQLAAKVVVEKADSVDGLLSLVEYKLPYIIRSTGARVVIIDSVTAVFRPEFDNARSRASHLLHMVDLLKRALLNVEGVAICVNQVSQRFEVSSITGTDHVPALGSVWSSCVNMRLFMERPSHRRGYRTLRVLSASHIPSSCPITLLITSDGVVGENEAP